MVGLGCSCVMVVLLCFVVGCHGCVMVVLWFCQGCVMVYHVSSCHGHDMVVPWSCHGGVE